MRVVKLMLISIVVFAVLIYLMSVPFPDEVRILRAIHIGASKEKVQRKISDFREWQQWNEMVTAQDFTHCVYTDSSFSSDQIKANLVYSSPDSIRTALKNRDHISYETFYLIQITPDTIAVHWVIEIPLKSYPWEKFSGLVLESQMGPPMQNALVKLKKMVENNQ